MKKVIVNLCTSLDLFIEGANGEIDWCLTDQDYGMTEFLDSIDTIFIGRKSYEQLLDLLPNAFPGKKKIVFSSTLKFIKNSPQIISYNIVEEVKKIINRDGKDIWLFGGANLITTLFNFNLIDELIIAIHPLILGKGKPLFIDLNNRKKLTLTNTKTYSSGLVQLYYKVDK